MQEDCHCIGNLTFDGRVLSKSDNVEDAPYPVLWQKTRDHAHAVMLGI